MKTSKPVAIKTSRMRNVIRVIPLDLDFRGIILRECIPDNGVQRSGLRSTAGASGVNVGGEWHRLFVFVLSEMARAIARLLTTALAVLVVPMPVLVVDGVVHHLDSLARALGIVEFLAPPLDGRHAFRPFPLGGGAHDGEEAERGVSLAAAADASSTTTIRVTALNEDSLHAVVAVGSGVGVGALEAELVLPAVLPVRHVGRPRMLFVEGDLQDPTLVKSQGDAVHGMLVRAEEDHPDGFFLDGHGGE